MWDCICDELLVSIVLWNGLHYCHYQRHLVSTNFQFQPPTIHHLSSTIPFHPLVPHVFRLGRPYVHADAYNHLLPMSIYNCVGPQLFGIVDSESLRQLGIQITTALDSCCCEQLRLSSQRSSNLIPFKFV